MAFDIKTAKPITETIEKDTSVSVSASPEMGEPIQPKEPKLKEGGFDVGSAAVFFHPCLENQRHLKKSLNL